MKARVAQRVRLARDGRGLRRVTVTQRDEIEQALEVRRVVKHVDVPRPQQLGHLKQMAGLQAPLRQLPLGDEPLEHGEVRIFALPTISTRSNEE